MVVLGIGGAFVAIADDATQAAWVIAWKKLGNVRDEAHLRPWLVSVAANEAKKLLTKRRRRAEFEAGFDDLGGRLLLVAAHVTDDPIS